MIENKKKNNNCIIPLSKFESINVRNLKSGESYTDHNGLTHYVLDSNLPALTNDEKKMLEKLRFL